MEEKPATAYLADQTNYKSGYLVKQGGRIKTWKRRLFILDRRNKVLKYYKKPQDTVPKGVIHLEGYQIMDGDDAIKKSFAIMVTKEGFRTYYLICEDLQTKLHWTEDLRETAKTAPKGPSVTIIIDHNATTNAYDADSDDDDETLKRPMPAFQSQSQSPPRNIQFQNGSSSAPPKASPPVRDEATLFAPTKTMTLLNAYDANATLVGFNSPNIINDPNATLISETHDPNATLIRGNHPRMMDDPNLTLVGSGRDEDATLMGDGAYGLTSNLAKIRAMGQPPQLIPHIKLIPFNPYFPIVERDVLRTLKIGRKSNEAEDLDFIGFDTKVVSRRHSEIWAVNGEFYIRDTRSQSGTFLNAMRLSLPGEESKPFKLNSGDTIQFGVDYRGTVDNSTRCVSMSVELAMIKPGDKPPMLNVHMADLGDLTLIAGSRS